MATLLCLSDQHGYLPDIATPADVAVIAGDIVPALRLTLREHTDWIRYKFIPWLQRLPVKHVAMTWGNHDWVGEKATVSDDWWPSNCHMLVNQAATIEGVTFYGVPQTPRFYDWAYNEDDTPESLGARWGEVPNGVDVLISHGPPRGTCDWLINSSGERAGSVTQADWLQSQASNRPRIVICGHLHAAGGSVGKCGDISIYNVGLVDDGYQLVRQPTLVRLEPR